MRSTGGLYRILPHPTAPRDRITIVTHFWRNHAQALALPARAAPTVGDVVHGAAQVIDRLQTDALHCSGVGDGRARGLRPGRVAPSAPPALNMVTARCRRRRAPLRHIHPSPALPSLCSPLQARVRGGAHWRSRRTSVVHHTTRRFEPWTIADGLLTSLRSLNFFHHIRACGRGLHGDW